MAPTAETPAPPLVGWTGLLFVIGSALFMLGVPLSLTTALPALASAATFTVGAGFFTTAALLQLLLARRDLPESAGRTSGFWRGKAPDFPRQNTSVRPADSGRSRRARSSCR